MLGTRGSDVKGYGEAVAKRVAFAVYQMLNRQYGGKVGDLRAHINALQDERDRAKDKYDELMGRVVGILGEEYRTSEQIHGNLWKNSLLQSEKISRNPK